MMLNVICLKLNDDLCIELVRFSEGLLHGDTVISVIFSIQMILCD